MLPPYQRIIGLTGGIATGKSLLATHLGDRHGLPILDADHYARQIVDSPAIVEQLTHRYGAGVLNHDGTVNRPWLAELIFANEQERAWLNGLVHPRVRDRLLREARNHAPQSVVLVVPLLFEAAMTDLVTEIWVVTCSEQQQLQRLMARSNLDEARAWQRIQSQWPLAQKVALADVVLDNSHGPPYLFTQADWFLSNPRTPKQ